MVATATSERRSRRANAARPPASYDQVLGCGDERQFGLVEVDRVQRHPLLDGLQPAAVIQLTVTRPEGLPRGRRRRQMAVQPQSVAVVIQPTSATSATP